MKVAKIVCCEDLVVLPIIYLIIRIVCQIEKIKSKSNRKSLVMV